MIHGPQNPCDPPRADPIGQVSRPFQTGKIWIFLESYPLSTGTRDSRFRARLVHLGPASEAEPARLALFAKLTKPSPGKPAGSGWPACQAQTGLARLGWLASPKLASLSDYGTLWN